MMGFSSWFVGGVPCLRDEKDIDKALNVIKENLLRARKTEDDLRKQLKEARDAAYSSVEMQKMKQELEKAKAELYLGFPMTAEENKKVAVWQAEHDANVHSNPNQYHGCAGGGYEFVFYPTSIGTAASCICDRCKYKAIKESKGDTVKYQKLLKEYGGEFQFQELG